MPDKRKTFRVGCPHCEQSFHVRYGQKDAQAEASGKAVVVVDCLHCGRSSTIAIPRSHVAPDVTIRGVASDLRPAARQSGDDEAAD